MPLPRVGDTIKGDVGCAMYPHCLDSGSDKKDGCPLPDCFESLETPGRIAVARAFSRGGLQEASATMETIIKGAWTPLQRRIK